jgi:HEAT repeat protein
LGDVSMTTQGPILERLCALLRASEGETARAAARVLGALGVSAPECVAALGEALGSPDRELRLAALAALSSIGGASACEHIERALADPGDLGRRAAEALVVVGGTALPRLAARLETADEVERRRILEIAARLGGAAAADLVLRALELGHVDREAVSGLAAGLLEADPADRDRIVARLESFLAGRRAQERPDAAEAAIGVLARVAETKDQRRLLALARSAPTPESRRAAIEALGRLAAAGPLEPDVVDGLFELVEDPDYARVAAPAMASLETSRLSAAHATRLIGYLSGNDPALRRFAASALGQVDTPRSAAALLSVLQGDNPELRQRAALALAKLRSAVGPAAEALAQVAGAQTAWILARILLPQVARLRPEHVAALAKSGAAWLEAGDPRGEAVVALLRERHGDALREACLARVAKLKKARKPAEILNLLRPAAREGAEPPLEVRYEIALAEVAQGRKDVVREARLGHPGLAVLEELARRPDFDLLARLRREKAYLSAEDYYLIGCHFAERPHAERALGGELLRWLVKTFPEESVAQSATNKLLMEGFPPPAPPSVSRSGTARPKARASAKRRAPARRK